MSQSASGYTKDAITGEPEVVEDVRAHGVERARGAVRASTTPAGLPTAWHQLKSAVVSLRGFQRADGSVDPVVSARSREVHELVDRVIDGLRAVAAEHPHDAAYLEASVRDFERWVNDGFGVPDFYDSLVAFRPELQRVDGRRHVVVFPMYTQNGSPDKLFEAVAVEVIWPEFVAQLEAGDYSNALFVPIRFLDFTPGYDTNSAVLFPETVSMRAVPAFTWGAIFADREAARFRLVVREAADVTRLELPAGALELLGDQRLAEETFVMWDLIHDRTHMRGDLPFDPFMIKQRMPYFLYSLEELRCDLTAFREAVRIARAGGAVGAATGGAVESAGAAGAGADASRASGAEGAYSAQAAATATRVQYAILFDRIFRFALTGSRVRNYDGLGGQLLFAWLHQRHVLHWTDTKLTIDWPEVADQVIALGDAIDELYWRSIDRPKTAHWLAAYALVSSVLTPNPASVWAKGADALPLDGPPRGLTDAVLDDEFPLSMFYEALSKKLTGVIESTAGITGASTRR